MSNTKKKAKIAIIGRENVGKSTLFNRLVEKNQALISNIAGTTRDRIYGKALWRAKELTFIDTAGFDINKDNPIKIKALEQFQYAINEADLILLVVDAQTGIINEDYELVDIAKKSKKPIILVVNKADNNILKNESYQFLKLGLKTFIAVSAQNGRNTGDLLDLILEKLKNNNYNLKIEKEKDSIKIVFLGQTNVGKSSLINAILNENRVIVSDLAHTTRESNIIPFKYKKHNFELIDTAGIRKHKRKASNLEQKSIQRSLQSLKQADIIILVLDINKGIEKQDIHLAGLAKEANKGIIIVANKWDLIKDKDVYTINKEEKKLKEIFKFIKWAPIIFSSAIKKQRVKKILDTAIEIQKERNKWIDNAELKNLLMNALKKRKPPHINNPKIKELEQIDIAPPTFLLIAKYPKKIHFSYLRYLENQIRAKYSFKGTSIKFIKKALK